MAVEPGGDAPEKLDKNGGEQTPPEVDAEIVDAEFADAPQTLKAEAGAPDAKAPEIEPWRKRLGRISPGLGLFIGFVAIAVGAFVLFVLTREESAPTEAAPAAPTAEMNAPASEESGPQLAPADAAKITNDVRAAAEAAGADVDASSFPPSTRDLPPPPPPGSTNDELQKAAKAALRPQSPDDGDAIDQGPAPPDPAIRFETQEPVTPPANEEAQAAPVRTSQEPAVDVAPGEVAAIKESFERQLAQRDAQANAEIASLRAEVEQLRSAQLGGGAAARDPASYVALASLQRAVDSGNPYTEELDRFARLAAGSPPVEQLRPGAAVGVPSLAVLKEGFDAAARAAIAASARENAKGWLGGVAARVQQMISIRPAGPTAGSGTAQIISRAEASLERNDLREAAAEIGALKGAPASEFAPWLRMAHSRLTADQALAALNAFYLTAYQN